MEEVKGIGFQMADQVAKQMGVENSSPYRLLSGIKHVLALMVNQGHTFVFEEDLNREASRILGVSVDQVKEELTELILKGDLHRSTIDQRPAIYLVAYYNAELNITKIIKTGLWVF